MQTIIMYPMNATSLILGRKLLSNDHNLSLYCPEDVHKRQVNTISNDLKISALGLMNTVEEVDTLEKFPTADLVIFPTLECLPQSSRSDFGKMCRNLFRNLKSDNIQFNDDVSVIFGGNVSGLISAREFGEVFPELRNTVSVTSSVYHASRHVFADQSDKRVFPMVRHRGSRKLVYTGVHPEGNELLNTMRGAWSLNSFNNTEADVIFELVCCIKDLGHDFSVLEALGKFPTQEEMDTYEIASNTPVWLPTRRECSQFTTELVSNLKCLSEWMESGYKEA
eukprot:GFUD01130185.1.p1 GENE.GFUD01130185.1~~GFUD01130185.1.p1  ORF type:complete len:280 (-),score=16.46 GFUD01130185.1:62-901(-)